jgi:hypothetical protein
VSDVIEPAIEGTRAVLSAAAAASPRPARVVVTSSVCAIHDQHQKHVPLAGRDGKWVARRGRGGGGAGQRLLLARARMGASSGAGTAAAGAGRQRRAQPRHGLYRRSRVGSVCGVLGPPPTSALTPPPLKVHRGGLEHRQHARG